MSYGISSRTTTLQGIAPNSTDTSIIYSKSETRNLFIGTDAGNSITKSKNATGKSNIFIGAFTGQSTTSGGDNTFLGNLAGNLNIMGSRNTYIGSRAGLSNQSTGNVSLGADSATTQTGNYNVSIGDTTTALYASSKTVGNISIGSKTQYYGVSNISLGNTNVVNSSNSLVIGNGIQNTGDNSIILSTRPLVNYTDDYVNIGDVLVKETGVTSLNGSDQKITLASNCTSICSIPDISIHSEAGLVKIGNTVYIPGDLVVTGNAIFNNLNLTPLLNDSNFLDILEDIRSNWGQVKDDLGCCSKASFKAFLAKLAFPISR